MTLFFPRMLNGLLFCSMALFTAATHAAPTCDAKAFGAKGDGHTKDTTALQKAIDQCAAKGGTVKLSEGTFVSAPLVLRSKVTLWVDAGATLLGSPDHEDYPKITELRSPALQPLLSSENASDLTITGGGTIDGNGESWWKEARAEHDHGIVGTGYMRPRLLVLSHSRHIRIENVTIRNSPFWQVVPYYSDDITIRNVKITADPHSPNTDAIDPFSSSNMVIDHVYADVGDDNIAIKSGVINSPGPDAPSKNITITDCTFMHGHGLSIGSEIAGGAQNIRGTRIHFKSTDQGVRIKANRDRGSDVSGIQFSDITMEDVATPILISEYYPKVMAPENDPAQPVGRLTPQFHDIVIEKLNATGAKMAGVIIGLPEAPVKDVVLRDISIHAQTGMSIANATVSMHDVKIEANQGEAIMTAPTAKVVQAP